MKSMPAAHDAQEGAALDHRHAQAHLHPRLRGPAEPAPLGPVLDLAAAERSRKALSAFQQRTYEGRAAMARRVARADRRCAEDGRHLFAVDR